MRRIETVAALVSLAAALAGCGGWWRGGAGSGSLPGAQGIEAEPQASPDAVRPAPAGAAATPSAGGASSDQRNGLRPASRVERIRVEPAGRATWVVVELDGAIEAEVSPLPPDRVVIDLPGTTASLPLHVLEPDDAWVRRVRVGQHERPRRMVRVVIDLGGGKEIAHHASGNRVLVAVGEAEEAPIPADLLAPAVPVARELPRGDAVAASPSQPRPSEAPSTPGAPGELPTSAAAPAAAPSPAAPARVEAIARGIETPAPLEDVAAEGGEPPDVAARGSATPQAAALGAPGEDAVPEGTPPAGPVVEEPTGEGVSEELARPGADEAFRERGTVADLAEPGVAGEPAGQGAIERRDRPPADRAASRAAGGPVVSLELEGVDVRTAIELIARAGGYQVIFAPDVGGKTSVRIVGRPWEEALRTVLEARQLREVRHEDVMMVLPRGRGGTPPGILPGRTPTPRSTRGT